MNSAQEESSFYPSRESAENKTQTKREEKVQETRVWDLRYATSPYDIDEWDE